MAAIDNNLNAFKLLFEIETAVREFLIMRCEKDIGIDWFESVFPKVVVDKSKTIGAQGNKNFSISWKATDMRPAWTQYGEITRKLDSWKNLFETATQFDIEKAWAPQVWQEGFNQWETADEATRVSKEAHDAAISIHALVKSRSVTWKQLEQSDVSIRAHKGAKF